MQYELWQFAIVFGVMLCGILFALFGLWLVSGATSEGDDDTT